VAEDAVEFVIVPAAVVVKGAHLGELFMAFGALVDLARLVVVQVRHVGHLVCADDCAIIARHLYTLRVFEDGRREVDHTADGPRRPAVEPGQVDRIGRKERKRFHTGEASQNDGGS